MKHLEMHQLKRGYLLFQCGRARELLSVSGNTSWRFDHVGMVVDANTIIDATPQYGVTERNIDQFLKRGQTFVAIVRHEDIALEAIEKAKFFLKRPYNFTFHESTEGGLYCSQLVTESFEMANRGEPYFKPDVLNFKDSNGTISNYWTEYYKKYYLEVPQGRKGSHPSRLYGDRMIEKRILLNRPHSKHIQPLSFMKTRTQMQMTR